MYRLLEIGETVEPGDEFYNELDREWWSASNCVAYEINERCRPVRRKSLGCRPLDPEEIVQDGDEFWDRQDRKWAFTTQAGMPVPPDAHYRRKIAEEPEPGCREESEYRRLKVGELIREGDEFCDMDERDGDEWWPTGFAGGLVPKGAKYRRPLSAETPPEHRPLRDGEVIQDGDEFEDGGEWHRSNWIGRTYCEEDPVKYRRKISPSKPAPLRYAIIIEPQEF